MTISVTLDRRGAIALCLVLGAAVASGMLVGGEAFAAAPGATLDYQRDIKPILSNHCFRCHGPDADERKGGTDGLRLDTLDGATADLGGSRAIAPGKPDDSVLLKRILSTAEDEMMPPPGQGRRLTPKEVEMLTTWIRQGAPYAQHWSYVKPVRPAVPEVQDATWSRNPIDRFLLARMEKEGLKPQPEADRYTLIRRASLDLTGLPPTIAEVDEFVQDQDPKAYEKLIDRLLKKSSYGEHWAHMWLDLARYADSAGYADDPPRTIWLYRDYVIRSLNSNKPFDQFTVEQLAGDLLPNPTDEQLTATAFHRNTLTNNEGGTNDEEFRNVAVADRVTTTMAVWMGTTMTCAQCHNHKYDPISQEDFFRVYAILNNTADADRGDESPLLSYFTPDQQERRSTLESLVAELEKKLTTATPEIQAGQKKWEAAFPRDLAWQVAQPTAAATASGTKATIGDDGVVFLASSAANEKITVELPAPTGAVRGLRIEALPDDRLPGKGPGLAGGNFVLTSVSANWAPAAAQGTAGRFVRIEIPGKQKILSLAEVQVFQGADNVARQGKATQSSTDFGGPPELALDGNTNGKYTEAKSTTHTAISDDPWWEVDLGGVRAIDRIVLWNRTDPNTMERLSDFRISILDEQRKAIWTQTAAAAPKPNAEFSTSGARSIPFAKAVADFAQDGFGAEFVLQNKDPKQKGWAVGGAIGAAHALTLVADAPIEIPAGGKVTLVLDHASQHGQHVLGKFRLSWTADARAEEFGRTPLPLVAALATAADQRTAEQKRQLEAHYLSIAPELAPVRQQIADVRKQLADMKPTTVPVLRELPDNQRRVTRIQHRGNFLDLGKEVSAGLPGAFPAPPPGEPMNRLTLAKWLVSPDNPLTARVIANRYWEQLFGVGIVATSEEFGSQGDLPFHPELLDWLAVELQARQWNLKEFVKLIVTSAAYRQSSRVTPDLMQRDPDNRLAARGPRFRLSAETIRDQALAASGLMSGKMYGPPVKPPQPSMGLSAAFGSGIDWQTSSGEDKYRRALYTTWRRSNPYPSMATFDAPNREVCTVRRVRTNTPLQALVTLNDPVYIEAAQALGRRAIAEGGSTLEAQLTYAFRLCLARPPQPVELQRLAALHAQATQRFQKETEAAKKMATEPLGPPPANVDVPTLAAWTVTANVILNLDETLMKR
ncbi:MAG: DUF1553 domain-containing protein [Pirellulales bacterium]